MDKQEYVYRYTSEGRGIFMAEDELEPPELEPEINRAKAWLPAPKLDCECEFYMTEKGREIYEQTLRPLHEKFMPEISVEAVPRSELEEIVYEDEFQVAEKKF